MKDAKKIKAVLFDLDGTLLNTLDDLTDSVNYALAENDLPLHTVEDIRRFVGDGVEKLMERAIPDGKGNPVFGKAFEQFKAHYQIHMQDKTAPYEGVIPLLKKLRSDGFGIAVVSNKYIDAVRELCCDCFGDLVQYAVGESESVRRKPAPDTLNEALRLLGLNKDEAVFVGDSDVDIKTAANAGVRCISVTWGFRERSFLAANGASEMIDSPEQLIDILY